MRCVFDANVIISASLSKYSVPFRAFEFVLDHHTLLLSKETFEELESTLFKTKFNKYFFPEDTRPGVLGTVLKYSAVILPDVKVNVCRDQDDNKYLELALCGKADCIVTGDPDLQILNPFDGILIISPKEFLDRFAGPE